MTTNNATSAKLTTVVSFPEQFFLENLAVRRDGSILVTVLNEKQLWYVPAPGADLPVDPVPVHTFDGLAMGIVEAESDIFYVVTMGPATVERLDLRDWAPGAPTAATRVLTFDQPGAVLNGCCLIAPRIMLVADSLAGLIWRVDLSDDGLTATARVCCSTTRVAQRLVDPVAAETISVNFGTSLPTPPWIARACVPGEEIRF
jgi:hypothetical protein